MNAVIDAMLAVPVAPAMPPKAYLPEKQLLTNRIGRHSARIKAAPKGSLSSWLLRPIAGLEPFSRARTAPKRAHSG
jgi:hypothetical protein